MTPSMISSRSVPRPALSRRDWLRLAAVGGVGAARSGWLPALAAEGAAEMRGKRACILLWMPGGPSQTDTFDPKPGHKNNGPFKSIDTSVPGVRFSEHLPQLAAQMDRLAVIRSMSTKEGDHLRASQLMRTGYAPDGPISYPTLGSLLSKELGTGGGDLPDYVSVGSPLFAPRGDLAGFLGSAHAPLVVGNQRFEEDKVSFEVANLRPSDFAPAVYRQRRLELLRAAEDDFRATHPDPPVDSRRAAYDRALRMMSSSAAKAFTLDDEPAPLRDRYGRGVFGQGCLLARRLVERGVPFVEVNLSDPGNGGIGWDTHQDNFDQVRRLSTVLDAGWATLMSDLQDRGLLDSTLIVWMGEFGRTPIINAGQGRDHFPAAWTTVLGGAVRGGQTVGRTDEGGMAVADRPVSHNDLIATICQCLGIDHNRQNASNVGRPIRLADVGAKPIREVVR